MFVPDWIKHGAFYQSFAADLSEEQERSVDEELDFPPETHPFFVSLPYSGYVLSQMSTAQQQALLEQLTAAVQYWGVPEERIPVLYFVTMFHRMGADLYGFRQWLAGGGVQGSPEYLAFLAEWSQNRRTRLDTSIAAKHGFLNAMVATRDGARGWSKGTLTAAAGPGHLDCASYVREHGYPWTTSEDIEMLRVANAKAYAESRRLDALLKRPVVSGDYFGDLYLLLALRTK